MGNVWRNIGRSFNNWLPKAAETNKKGDWGYWYWMNEACRVFYSGNHIEPFSDRNAYRIACTVAEVFFPIDAIADRVASLKFDVVNESGEIVEPPKNIQRLIEQPNIFSSFSGLIYESVFNELSDGNNFIYTKTPRSIKGISPDTISSVWVLQPDRINIKVKDRRPKIFDVKNLSDIIESISYSKYDEEDININHITIERSMGAGCYRDGLKSRSPLCAAEMNINNLLAVYQARYKVYANNGNAGILTRDPAGTNSMEQVVDPATREEIVNDILDRNGLIGDKKLWTVSAIPLKFIKTLATINELQPFEETREDALQIAGIYGVDKDLIPMKEGTTFTNNKAAEKKLYQNVIKGVASDKAETFTKAFALDSIGLRFKPNYEDVEVLQEDIETSHRGDGLLIDNLIKMQDSGMIESSESKEIVSKLIEQYKNG